MRPMTFIAMFFSTMLLASLHGGWWYACEAGEPAQEFLQALRERQYYDVALEYLTRLQERERMPPELAETVQYELGTTLLDAARNERSTSRREPLLDRAQEKLEAFIAAHGDHELAPAATRQMAALLMERAGLRVAEAEEATQDSEKQAHYVQARGFYDRAFELYQGRKQAIRKQLEAMPQSIDPEKQASQFDERGELRAEYVHVQLVAATITYDKAATFKDRPDAYRDQLQQAADAYGEIAEKYDLTLAGLYSVLYRGRCYQDMGQFKEALSLYEELLQQPEPSGELLGLQAKALRRAMECRMDDTIGELDLAIGQADQWLTDTKQNGESDADVLGVRWLLAQACYRAANQPERTRSDRSRLLATARTQARLVSQQGGEYTRDARALLAQIYGRDTQSQDESKEEEGGQMPATYAEAKKRGQEALERVEEAILLTQLVEQRLPEVENQQRREEMQQQLAGAEETLRTACPEGIALFRRALQLADADTGADELNPLRHALCQLYYIHEDYFEAAVLGHFLARRYPNFGNARHAAQIAMASYYKLYSEEGAQEFAARRMIVLADQIVAQWSGQREAEEALSVLVTFMVQQGDVNRAEAYLEKIPADSSRRGQAELNTGQALWAQYLSGIHQRRQTRDGTGNGPDDASLEQLRARSKKLLMDGLQRLGAADVDATMLRGALSLAQIHVEAGEPAEASEILDDPDFGPQTLLDRNDPRVAEAGLAEAIYQTTLRASIAALPKADDTESAMKKAIEVMEKLKRSIGGTPEGDKKLVRIYVSVTRDLQRQMEASMPDTKRSLLVGLETFLRQVAQEAQDFDVLYWVAETFYRIGTETEGQGATASEESRALLKPAAATYQKILDLAEREKWNLDPNTLIQIRRRLAQTAQRFGQFQSAAEIYEAILRDKNRAVNIQIEAARLYQAWAMSGQSEYFIRAILGDLPDKKTKKKIIWGWAQLAKVAVGQMYRSPESKQKYRDVFHEAQYNIALCLFEKAMLQSGKEQQEDLRRAKTAIVSTHVIYPEMGRPTWRPRYDRLLKKIQQALGETPGGLKSLERPKAA